MKSVFKTLFVVTLLVLSLPVTAQRSGATKDPSLNRGDGLAMSRSDLNKMRNQNQDKNIRQTDLYMFASAFSMLDSVIYVSDIHKVDGVTVNNKWFLKNRVDFERQFMERVSEESVYDLEEIMLPVIYYSEKEKNVVKQREKLIKRNAKTNKYSLNYIQGFRFTNPIEVADSTAAQQ